MVSSLPTFLANTVTRVFDGYVRYPSSLLIFLIRVLPWDIGSGEYGGWLMQLYTYCNSYSPLQSLSQHSFQEDEVDRTMAAKSNPHTQVSIEDVIIVFVTNNTPSC